MNEPMKLFLLLVNSYTHTFTLPQTLALYVNFKTLISQHFKACIYFHCVYINIRMIVKYLLLLFFFFTFNFKCRVKMFFHGVTILQLVYF